ncbi:MAG TPA: glycosyltransferase [Candidatus Angelobacter sp.]|jgi:predicted ATP-grasp superfamily ATP-dependent carboligase/glycosyltransferase involved in cell wall biosynthesis
MVDVSVVIATYNRSRQVREAIDSVLAQTVPVREIIVVDDGSRDDTREQLLAYGDRIRPFFQANGGASAARNLAMRKAQGSWIAFLDDDDVWVPEKIEQQWKLVENDSALGLVYCSDYAVDEQLRVLYERKAQEGNRGEVFERLLIKNFIFTSCVMARRDAVEKAGYMLGEYKFAQDWDLWLKIAAENPVDFAPAPLVLYRQSPTGCLTHDMKADDRLLEMKTIMQRALALRDVSPATRRRAAFEIESQWASASLVNGKNAAALPHALRAVAAKPTWLEGYRLTAYSLVPSGLRTWAKKMLGRNAASASPAKPVAEAGKSAKPESAPPVIIMNMFYSGLAIARDLAGTGVRVIGLSSDPKAYGNFTRFCEVRRAPDSQSEPEKLAAFLQQAAGELQGAVIFPTRDADVVFLDRYREELKDYRISIPPRSALIQALDKGTLVQCAQAAGVPAPKSVVAHNLEELKKVPAELSFPCVVKPVSSYMWRGEEKWQAVGCRKAFLADNWEELSAEYDRVAKVNPDVLVQEWIPGSTKDIAIMGAYFGENSEALGYFCARKLVQEPDDFGTGCVVQAVPLQEIVEPSVRLCKNLGYRGMAEIEYKRDEKTGEYKLIEINTRHWDWHQLAHMSGVNLTRVAYSDLTGYKLDAATAAKPGGKWVAEDTLLMHSAAGIYNRRLTLRAVFRQLSGPKIFGIFKWADPMPFIRFSFSSMFPTMGRMAMKKLRSKG